VRPTATHASQPGPRLPRRSVQTVFGEVQILQQDCDASGTPTLGPPRAGALDQTHACFEAHSWLLPGLSDNDPKDTESKRETWNALSLLGFPQAAPSREPPTAEWTLASLLRKPGSSLYSVLSYSMRIAQVYKPSLVARSRLEAGARCRRPHAQPGTDCRLGADERLACRGAPPDWQEARAARRLDAPSRTVTHRTTGPTETGLGSTRALPPCWSCRLVSLQTSGAGRRGRVAAVPLLRLWRGPWWGVFLGRT
jgi:hypothetical protein